MRMVAGSILVLAGTIASSVGCFLGVAYRDGAGPAVSLTILGLVQLLSGARLLLKRGVQRG